LLDVVTRPRDLEYCTHAFGDVHEFREWMRAPREDQEQDSASEDLLSGRVTIAKTPVEHLGRHAGARPGCDLGHAYGALDGTDVRYGYCDSCDLILEFERVPPRDQACSLYDDHVWFPLDWDRRSRDGWIRARNERALHRARSLPTNDDDGDFERETDDRDEDL
jgi:hypothetical protein